VGEGDIFGGGRAEGQIELRAALDMLKPLFADRSILKLFHNVKYDLGILNRYGIEVRSFDDNLLLSYALDGPQFNTMGEFPSIGWAWHHHQNCWAPQDAAHLCRSADRKRNMRRIDLTAPVACASRGKSPRTTTLAKPRAALAPVLAA
jgi:hypothetical protein